MTRTTLVGCVLGVVAAILVAMTLRESPQVTSKSSLSPPSTSVAGEHDLVALDGGEGQPQSAEAAEHLHTKDVVVHFGDSDSVQVRFRDFDFEWINLPYRLADAYGELTDKALRGSGPAAFALYLIGEQCRIVAVDEEELERSINKLYSERTLYMPNQPSGTVLEDHDIARHEADIRTQFERCQGLSEDQRAAGRDSWLTLAAENGYLPAVDRLSWVSYEQGDVAKSLEYLNQAWSLGSPLALGGLYEVYLNGGDGIEPDPQLATAYLYLREMLFDARHAGADLGSVLERKNAANKSELNEQTASLRPKTAEMAKQMAQEILISNQHCCVDW